jgi:hypothetical protein
LQSNQPLQWEMFRGKFPKNELTIGRNTWWESIPQNVRGNELNAIPKSLSWGPGKENWKLETLFSLDSHYFRRSSDGKRLRWFAYMLNELFPQLGGGENVQFQHHTV